MSGVDGYDHFSAEDDAHFTRDIRTEELDELFDELDGSPNHVEGDGNADSQNAANTEHEQPHDSDDHNYVPEEEHEESSEYDDDADDDDDIHEEEESGSDADGDFELDDMISIPSPDNNGNIPIKQSSSQPSQAARRRQATPTPEEVEEWRTEKLEALNKRIALKRQASKKHNDKLSINNKSIAKKQAEYDRQYAARNMGAHHLEQILEAKGKLEDQAKKKTKELKNSQDRLREYENQKSRLEQQPLEEYKKENPTSGRTRRTRSTQNDPSYNVYEGDDSLSEKEDAKGSRSRRRKNAPLACRRCKANKRGCDMKRGQCTKCAMEGKRCRYNDPWVPGRQLHAYQLIETEEKLKQAQEQIAVYQHLSLTSVLADNPLSGITGYGPRPVREARQNYARLQRGLPSIVRPPPVSSGGQNRIIRAAPYGLRDNKNPQHGGQSKPANPEPPQTQINTQWIHQTVPPTNPAKRGRKPGQRSTKPKSGQTKAATRTPTEEQPQPQHNINLPHTDAVAVNPMQCWWANEIARSGGRLPVKQDFRPDWPAWTLRSNEKQILWFNYMLNTGQDIPSISGGAGDVLQPHWPGWTVVRESMSEISKRYLTSLLDGGHEIREIQNGDGTGQGNVDWGFDYSLG